MSDSSNARPDSPSPPTTSRLTETVTRRQDQSWIVPVASSPEEAMATTKRLLLEARDASRAAKGTGKTGGKSSAGLKPPPGLSIDDKIAERCKQSKIKSASVDTSFDAGALFQRLFET